MGKRYYINNGWEFTEHWSDSFLRQEPREDGGNLLSGVPDGAAAGQTEAGSDTWQQVRLPHTCKMTPYNYFDEGIYQMVCGYRRILRIPEAWKKDRVYLVIGAAGHSAEVFLNGKKAGEHHCGYTSFRTELTDFLQPGDNLLAVRVDTREQQNIPPFGHVIDYMTYGGLYREAYLETSGSVRMGDLINTQTPVHIRQDSLGQRVAARFVKLDGEKERYASLSGAVLMNGGVKLTGSYTGNGWNEEVRCYQDFDARLFMMEEAQDT